MRATLKHDLEITLEAALMLSEPMPIRALAKKIYDSEPALIDALKEPWIIDRLTWMLYRKQQRAVARKDQLTLPGFEGFEKLPQRITLKNGKHPELRDATAPQLREFRAVLVKRRDPRIKILDRLLALMKPHIEAKPGVKVTVAQVIAAERAKQEWKP